MLETIMLILVPLLAGIVTVAVYVILAIIFLATITGIVWLAEKLVTGFMYFLDERGGVDWGYVLSRAAEWTLAIVFLWVFGILGLLVVSSP